MARSIWILAWNSEKRSYWRQSSPIASTVNSISSFMTSSLQEMRLKRTLVMGLPRSFLRTSFCIAGIDQFISPLSKLTSLNSTVPLRVTLPSSSVDACWAMAASSGRSRKGLLFSLRENRFSVLSTLNSRFQSRSSFLKHSGNKEPSWRDLPLMIYS